MTDQERIIQLEKELADLKAFVMKDAYSDLKVFRKKIEFKSDVKLENIDTLIKTAGTAPIADGNHTITIPVGGGSATVATKNGIITSIT